jgi:integrase/recombinase XerD
VNALERTSDFLKLGDYSPLTIRSYLSELRWLFCYYPDTRPSQITREMTIEYLMYLVKTQGCSRVKCKMAAQSFSFFFRQVLNKPYQIPGVLFPARSAKLPAVMHPDEVKTVINLVQNVKHRTLISLLYSTGMRLREMAALKIEDIDSRNMRIKVVSGKGKKDRYTLLSQQMLLELRAYYIQYKPVVYLFNGQGKSGRYSERNIQKVFENALIKAGLDNKAYSIHTIRHSFATHLLDNGADLLTIKTLMGHANVSQTMQYLHLSTEHTRDVVNPFDVLHASNASTSKKTTP